ncbi:dihydrolipoamide acetyltransferase family protein [Oceanobacillus senegalensis]|uniref:dihydrolipoamide acetyltransferase family protein n=1 Tax=Oceanobacillus senegalensis TaxID=1936063 RepID=UPI000A309A24|nr:dihydrolipoamide acetyltransferase family protein [Oceanobacillus senegalensis]
MSIAKITMPQLGESVTEGTISSWLVNVGDKVNKYDPIAEVLTDKVNAEVPSSYTGMITEINAAEGDTISVGELMCTIETDEVDNSKPALEFNDAPKVKENSTQENDSMKKRYSPAVMRLAQEHHINLNDVMGSGRGGRITRKDIEKIIASGGKTEEKERVSEENPQKIVIPPQNKLQHTTTSSGDKEISVTGVRKAIAQNMVQSKQEIPHAWMTVEVDVTDLVAYRNKVKNEFKQEEGYNLTYFAFFVKAVAQALKKFPQLNSTWQQDNIIQKKAVNLSIAVASNEELFVPVIKHADEKNIKGIAREIHELALKARDKRLKGEDMEGGTFTVNNTGTFGSVQSMGIINHPQAAILQVESIVKRPVIIDDMFAARNMVNLCLSLDHRVLDGLICGKFLSYLKELLESMNEETIQIY